MTNILVVSGSKDEAMQFILIARELIKRDIFVHIATSRKHVYEFIKKNDWDHTLFMEIKKTNMSEKPDLAEYLQKYKNPTIAEMISSEQAVRNWDTEQKFHLLAKFLNIYEQYFDKHNIQLIMKSPTCSFTGRAAYAVSRRRGLPTLIINTGPIITETFTLNDIDEGWLWSEFFDNYNEKNIPVNTEQKSMVDAMAKKVMSDKKKSIQIKKANIKGVLYHLLFYIYQRIKGERDYVEKNELVKEISFFIGRLRKPAKYSAIDRSRPYIFFPLHIPWDAQISTRNPMFYSQEAIVEMLDKACPPGMTLYIKEHPYYAGGVNKKTLAGLRKCRSVKVLDPSISSLEAIKNAAAVVAINSTAGWESILLKKPLIVLGNPYYAYFKYAYKVENINQLPRILNEAVCKGDSIYNDTDEWYKFLYSAAFSTHTGAMVFYKNYMGLGKDLKDKRIKTISESLGKKINSLIKKN